MSYSIREMRKEEYSLLSDFLYEAIYIPDGTAAPPKSVITCPELQVYIADFGNSKHDKALIVEVDGNIVGAIWARIMNDYGHIDENTPSLAMSVLKAYRGMGIGTLLLTQMLLAEKAAGYPRKSILRNIIFTICRLQVLLIILRFPTILNFRLNSLTNGCQETIWEEWKKIVSC